MKKFFTYPVFVVLFLSFIGAIVFGFLVRQELIGSQKFGNISKYALFLAEIPVVFKRIYLQYKDLGIDNKLEKSDAIKMLINDKSELISIPNKLFIYSRYDGDKKKSIIEIIDTTNFKSIHTYIVNMDELNIHADIENFIYQKTNNSTKRARIFGTIDNDLNLYFHNNGSPLFSINKCSEFNWINNKLNFHHSINLDHDNNIWVASNKLKKNITTAYNNYAKNNLPYEESTLTKVSRSGKILYEKSLIELLIENDILRTNDLNSTVFDPIHLNDIQPILEDGKYWKRGDIIISMRYIPYLIIFRPSNNKIIKKIYVGNVQQHDVDVFNNNSFTFFNNNNAITKQGLVNKNSKISLYDLEINKFLDFYLFENSLNLFAEGLHEIIDNKYLFYEFEGYSVFEDLDDKKIKIYTNKNSQGEIYRTHWSSVIKDENKINLIKKNINEISCNSN